MTAAEKFLTWDELLKQWRMEPPALVSLLCRMDGVRLRPASWDRSLDYPEFRSIKIDFAGWDNAFQDVLFSSSYIEAYNERFPDLIPSLGPPSQQELEKQRKQFPDSQGHYWRCRALQECCGRLRLAIGVPPPVCFQIVYGRNPDHFQMIPLKYPGIEYKLAKRYGDYWETNKGSDLDKVAIGLAGNMRACYIQTALAALTNPSGRRQVDVNIAVKGPKQRAQGEAVQGDSILFEAQTKTGRYPDIFSVDTVGVIHPIYPLPNTEVRQMEPGARASLGTDGSFVVDEPFGKEMIFAVMLEKTPSSLASL